MVNEKNRLKSRFDGVVPPATAAVDGVVPPSSSPDADQINHTRSRSIASHSGDRPGLGGTGSRKGDAGTATFNILSASGFPPSAHMRGFVKTLGPKSSKEVHKTKAIKAGSGVVQFDASHETFCVQKHYGQRSVPNSCCEPRDFWCR
jgi:hypothetical protein